MAPIPIDQWWGKLPIASIRMSLPSVAEIAVTAGGEITTASLGARLWTIDVQLWSRSLPDTPSIQVMMRKIMEPGASALVTPFPYNRPRLDKSGFVLSTSPIIDSISLDRSAISIAGLQEGYTISDGDFFSIETSGVYHMHQVVSGAAADSSGKTGSLDVVPKIRQSVSSGDPVTLVNPRMKAVVDPSSVSEGDLSRSKAAGFGFSMIQTLKA